MIKGLLLTGLLIFSLARNCFAITELDYMEYSTDALAQAAYVSSGAGLDQSYTSAIAQADGNLLYDIGSVYYGAQSFVPGVTAPCSGIDVQLKQVGSIAGGKNIWLEIQSDDGSGKPSNTILATSDTIVANTISGTYTWYAFTFASPATLTLGTKYHIVAKGDWTPDATNFIAWNDDTSGAYASGNRSYTVENAPTTWISAAAQDLLFKEYYNNLQSYSESTIKTQGSYSLKGIAAITGSLNKTLTRTVSPTIDLSGRNTIKFDIYSSRTGANIKVGIHDSGGTTTEKTHTIAQANTWETDTWDISAVADADKNAIDSIIVTITNADAVNTFYSDNMFGETIRRIIFIQ